jgi:Na+-driven multidrug efflux pump
VVGISLLVLSELLARPLSMIFVSYNEALLDMTIHGFRIFAISFIICGFNIYSSSFFTALNNGLISAICSFLRTLIFQLIAVIVLPMIMGTDGIWLSVIVAEFMAAFVSIIFMIAKRKKYHY